MNPMQLYSHIKGAGISLTISDTNNITAYPRAAVTESIRKMIKDNKQLLVVILRQKQAELNKLIHIVSTKYGDDDEKFLSEYIDDILMHSDIEKALACFRDLAKQIPPVNNRK